MATKLTLKLAYEFSFYLDTFYLFSLQKTSTKYTSIRELPKQNLKMRAVLFLALLTVLVAAVNSGKSFNRKITKVSGIKNEVRNKFKTKIAKIKGFFAGIGNKFKRKFGKREAEPGFGKIRNFFDNLRQNIKRKFGKSNREPVHFRIRNKYNNVKQRISQKVQNKLNKIRSFLG